jgi:DNA-binding transcriptional LysR family regulator
LTEQGELLFGTVRDVFDKLALVEAQLSETKERPSGLLRVTTTVAFGSVWLAPRLREFCEVYPDMQFSMRVDDRELEVRARRRARGSLASRLVPPRLRATLRAALSSRGPIAEAARPRG